MRVSTFALVISAFMAASTRAAELHGVVLLNELEGAPVPNVSISADGAQPQVSDSNGCFDLDFGKDREPGDAVEIRVTTKEKDYVVIHSSMLQHTLLKDANGPRAKLIIARKGDREEMAGRFFRLRGDVLAEKNFQTELQELAQRHHADAASIARLKQDLARAKSAVENASETFARDSEEKTSPLYQQALKQFLGGNLDAALETLDEAVLRKQEEKAHNIAREVSGEYRLRGQLLTLKFRFAEATRAYQSAVETAPGDIEAHFALGHFYQSLNRQKEALVAYNGALALARKESNLPSVAKTLNSLGILHSDENRMTEARKAYGEALEIYRRLADKNPDAYLSDMAGTLNNLGILDSDENRMAEARKAYKEALQIQRQLVKKNPDTRLADVAETLNNLGNLDCDDKRLAEAREAYEEALKIDRQLAEKNPDVYLPAVAGLLNNLGNLNRDDKRLAKANEAFREALKIYRQLAEKNPDAYLPGVTGTLNNLGNLQIAENRMAEARTAYEEALRIRRQLAEKNPDTYLPDVATTLENLGNLYRHENREADARKAYEDAMKIYRRATNAAPDRFRGDVERVQKVLDELKN